MSQQAKDKLTVSLGDRSYDILVGSNLLNTLGSHIKPLVPTSHVTIITDTQVAGIYLEKVEASLKAAGISSHVIQLKPGEQTKSFSQLQHIVEEILSTKPERSSMCIALGGGVIGDITGFAASIILRGISFIQVPTTLLSQVDSSVGGKTGINSTHGKNLIGSFYQPKLVIADLDVLASLSERDFLSGYAEVVKYGAINKPEFFAWLEDNVAAIRLRDPNVLRHCVLQSCQAKAEIVSQDEKEKGARALLNLGHTFGHALEVELGYSGILLHGEAVAIGMVMAFQLSAQEGYCSEADVERLVAHLEAVGLPTSVKAIEHHWDADVLIEHMHKDKKVSDGKLVFILAKGLGKSYIDKQVTVGALQQLFQRIL